MFLGKTRLDTTEFLISKALVYLYIRHDESVSVNNSLREYNEMEEEIKHSETSVKHIYIKTMENYCVSYKKNTANENSSVRKNK